MGGVGRGRASQRLLNKRLTPREAHVLEGTFACLKPPGFKASAESMGAARKNGEWHPKVGTLKGKEGDLEILVVTQDSTWPRLGGTEPPMVCWSRMPQCHLCASSEVQARDAALREATLVSAFFLPRKQREFWWSQPYQPHTCLKSTRCECAYVSVHTP